MPYAIRIVVCVDCGGSFDTRNSPKWTPRCKPCANKNRYDHILAAKAGLPYEKSANTDIKDIKVLNLNTHKFRVSGESWNGSCQFGGGEVIMMLRNAVFDPGDILIADSGIKLVVRGDPAPIPGLLPDHGQWYEPVI